MTNNTVLHQIQSASPRLEFGRVCGPEEARLAEFEFSFLNAPQKDMNPSLFQKGIWNSTLSLLADLSLTSPYLEEKGNCAREHQGSGQT